MTGPIVEPTTLASIHRVASSPKTILGRLNQKDPELATGVRRKPFPAEAPVEHPLRHIPALHAYPVVIVPPSVLHVVIAAELAI